MCECDPSATDLIRNSHRPVTNVCLGTTLSFLGVSSTLYDNGFVHHPDPLPLRAH
jgi:hypothetical protein